jgi:hypothetical protein
MLRHSCHYKKHLLSSVFGTANCCSIALCSVISRAGKFLIFQGFSVSENRKQGSHKWQMRIFTCGILYPAKNLLTGWPEWVGAHHPPH